MSKRGVNSTKAKTSVVRGTVTLQQKKVIQELIGLLGSNEQDVVSKIITLWIYNEGYLRGKVIKKEGKRE